MAGVIQVWSGERRDFSLGDACRRREIFEEITQARHLRRHLPDGTAGRERFPACEVVRILLNEFRYLAEEVKPFSGGGLPPGLERLLRRSDSDVDIFSAPLGNSREDLLVCGVLDVECPARG